MAEEGLNIDFCEMYAFDEMTRGYGNGENREKRIEEFTKKAYELAINLA